MSTPNNDKFTEKPIIPVWTAKIDESTYHSAALSGGYVSSTMLREFRRCPLHYRDLTRGNADRRDSEAMRFGRAAHSLILEGEAVFRSRYAVGGPFNEKTGRSYNTGTKVFGEWLHDSGLQRKSVVTDSEYATLLRMRKAVFSHRELSRLLTSGWPELSARADIEGVACQARMDWLRPDNTAIDVKTVEDIGRFEQDARRFGYLHQFAFYCDVCREAGAEHMDMIAAVVKKSPRSGSASGIFPPIFLNRIHCRTAPICARSPCAGKTISGQPAMNHCANSRLPAFRLSVSTSQESLIDTCLFFLPEYISKGSIMKHIYINSRLTPLLLDSNVIAKPRSWIFSQGAGWLLLTPARFQRVTAQAGVDDTRIRLLIRVIRRYSEDPARFCTSIGVETARKLHPDEYPPVLCPRCDSVHIPHPDNAVKICDLCREQLDKARAATFAGGLVRDKRMDVLARERLLEMEPSSFFNGELLPNYKFNLSRRLHRDWDAAVRQILHGRKYKDVAAEFDCSVGVLHKVVTERYWENN